MLAWWSCMDPSAAARKLLIRPNARAAVVNPPAGYTETLAPLPDGATLLGETGGEADVVRDAGELMGRDGLTGVTLVAIDGTWSAMRFRPAGEVGT